MDRLQLPPWFQFLLDQAPALARDAMRDLESLADRCTVEYNGITYTVPTDIWTEIVENYTRAAVIEGGHGKIMAIKLLREHGLPSMGLKEAKDIIDARVDWLDM
jgi:hypothetical protein